MCHFFCSSHSFTIMFFEENWKTAKAQNKVLINRMALKMNKSKTEIYCMNFERWKYESLLSIATPTASVAKKSLLKDQNRNSGGEKIVMLVLNAIYRRSTPLRYWIENILYAFELMQSNVNILYRNICFYKNKWITFKVDEVRDIEWLFFPRGLEIFFIF